MRGGLGIPGKTETGMAFTKVGGKRKRKVLFKIEMIIFA